MAIGRSYLVVTLLLLGAFVLWRSSQSYGNATTVAGNWDQITPVTVDEAIEAWTGEGLPIWKVRPDEGGLVAIADISVRPDCTTQRTRVGVTGRQVLLRTSEQTADEVSCSWRDSKTQWAEHRLSLEAGVYSVTWELADGTIRKYDIAVSN